MMDYYSDFSALWNRSVNNAFDKINSKIYPTRSILEQLGVMKSALTEYGAAYKNDPVQAQESAEVIRKNVGKLIPMVRAIKEAVNEEIADIRLDIELGFPSSQVWPRISRLNHKLNSIIDSGLSNVELLGDEAFDITIPDDFIDYMNSHDWNSELKGDYNGEFVEH